jgi:hypothetical protein
MLTIAAKLRLRCTVRTSTLGGASLDLMSACAT